jgi:hypothetical protein
MLPPKKRHLNQVRDWLRLTDNLLCFVLVQPSYVIHSVQVCPPFFHSIGSVILTYCLFKPFKPPPDAIIRQ